MRAIVKTGHGPESVALREVDRPVPEHGQAVIQVSSVGICGTDLHILADEYPTTPPVVLGHEVAGLVAEIGPGVDPGLLGLRVATETYYSACESCYQCRAGRRNLCPQRRSIGSHVDGGFATHLLVPAINLHQVDESVGEHAAALYEPLACVAHCLADPAVASPGDTALVVGPGAMGLLAAQVLAAQGAAVTVSGTADDRLRLAAAEALGLTAVVADALQQAVPPAGFDLVAECSGSAAGMAAGMQAVRKGGRYVAVGLAGKVVPVDMDLICLKELRVTSGFASTPVSWRRAQRLVAGGLVRLDPLVSGVYPLAEWATAFDRARQGEGVKFVIDPREARHGS